MSLSYFRKGSAPPTREWAKANGLDYMLDGLGVARRDGSIPEAGRGFLFSRGRGDPGTRPHWEPHLEAGGVWVGWDPANPPGPAELARAQQFDGHMVRLADGRDWLIPVARRWALGIDGKLLVDTPFPRRITFGGGGAQISGPSDQSHRFLWEQATRYWRGVVEASAGVAVEVTMADTIDLAAAALTLNYRVSRTEIGALGLLSTESIRPICEALCDMPSLPELVGRMREDGEPPRPNSEGPALERGPEGLTQATPQPSLTSTP